MTSSAASQDATLGAMSDATNGALTDATSLALSPSTMPASTAPSLSAPTFRSSASLPVGSLLSTSRHAASSSSTYGVEPFNFSNLMTIKLSGGENYLLWRAAILPLLRSRYLMGYVDGSYPCPPERVLQQLEGGRTVSVFNPEHRSWVMQDQAILSGIVSSLMPQVGGLIMFATTAEEAWVTLQESFSQQSTAQSVQIRTQLGEVQKLNSTVSVYFNKIKNLSDQLTALGQPLRPEEFSAYVLKGLDEDYDNLAENVNGRETPISARDLHSRLIFTEQRVEARRAKAGVGFSNSSANAAYRGGGRGAPPKPAYGNTGGYSKQPSSSKPPSPTQLPISNNGGAPSGGSGGRRWNTQDGNRPICQLCNAVGHVAARCWKRFDKNFLGVGNDGTNMERQVAMLAHGTSHGHAPPASYQIDPAWYMDSGATDHLTGDIDNLHVKEPYQGKDHVHTANGSGMRISHVDQSTLATSSNRSLHLKNILYVPQVTRNLLSAHKLALDNNVFVEIHPFDCLVKDRVTRATILRGRAHGGLYPVAAASNKQVYTGVRVSSSKWHCRLGHPAAPVVQHVIHKHALPIESSNKDIHVCDACQQGKSHQLPFSSSTHVIKAPLELIYSNVWGPAQTSVSGHNYYVSFIDAFSRFTWLYLLKRKSDVFNVFVQFQTHVERLLQHKILHVHTDWGGEYRNLNTFFQKLGITHRVACPHTHQQNGAAERKHRHIVETGLTLLAHASVPFHFWSDAFTTSCFLINRVPTRVLEMSTPLEKLLHETPDYSFLKVFGCACWPHLRPYNNHKLEF